MATDHNFRVKNGLEVGGVLIVNSSGQLQATTISGAISATSIGVTNIVTNKVVKFNGSILDDSNITDTGSLITLGSNTAVSGAITSTGNITSATTGTGNAKLIADGGGAANVELDRGSTSYHNNLLYRTAGAVKWRIWQSGADNILAIRNEVASTNVLSFTDTNATFSGTISSGAITSSGNIGAASGHVSGKFAVKSSSVHGSYDLYNNGTTYLNGSTIVDDTLNLTGGNAKLQIGSVDVIDTNRVLKNITRVDFANFTAVSTSTTSPSVLRYANIGANPEGSHMSHPYLFNDLANFEARGGTVTVSGLSGGATTTECFRANGRFASWSNSNYSGSTMTITLTNLPHSLSYGGYIGIAFGNTTWCPSSMKIEVSTDGGSTWTTRLNSASTKELYFTTTGTGGTGANAIRFTIGQAANSSSIRLTNIWAYNYNSNGMEDYFLSKAGGTLYGTLNMGANAITSTGSISSGAITSSGSLTLSSNGISVNTRSLLARDTNGLNIGTTNATTAISIDNSANVTMPYNLTVSGNLTINGTTTTLNTATLDVEDKNITLNYGTGDTSGSANGAGITIQDAVNSTTDATILWNAGSDQFDFSNKINVSGDLQAQNIYGLDVHVLNAAGNGWHEWATRNNNKVDLNVGTISSGVITATGGNSTNWNTAYGWGNHASAGYLTSSSTQSKYLRSDAADTGSGKITLTASEGLEVFGIRGRAVGSQSGDFIQMYERVSIGYPSGWGAGGANNAPTQGLTTHGGAMFNTGNVSGAPLTFNGNTIWRADNDGSGSGLDADLLDGINSGSFLRSDANDTATGRITLQYGVTSDFNNIGGTQGVTAFYAANVGGVSNRPDTGNYATGLEFVYHDTSARSQLAAGSGGSNNQANFYVRSEAWSASNSWTSWYKLFHTGNDGSGSGLDADTVDGVQASQFLRSDADDSTTGNIAFSQPKGLNFANGQQIKDNGGGGLVISSSYQINLNQSTGLTTNSNAIWHAGNDGSGSTLDADLLDGQHGSYYYAASNPSGYTTYTANQSLNTTDSPTFANLNTANTGYVGIGDDVRIKDVSVANTAGIVGQQNTDRGYLTFGNNTTQLGRIGTGALTWGGNTIWHSGNDGSGSGLDADTIDGYSRVNHFGVGEKIDISVGGDADTWYPVVISGGGGSEVSNFQVYRGYGETAPSTWNTSTHMGGLSFKYSIVGSSGWGGYPTAIRVQEFGEIYSRMLGGIAFTAHSMKHVVWLRGGTATYHIYSDSDISVQVNDSTSASNYVSASPHKWYSYNHSNNAYDVTVSEKTSAQANTGVANEVYLNMPVSYNSAGTPSVYGIATSAYNHKFWNSSNDGSGSGLDADLLDGINSGSFVRSDITNSINLTITGVMQANNGYKVGSTTRINSVGDMIGTSYYIGSTNIIDTSANLTNIGTIGSTHFSTSANVNSSGAGGANIPNGKRLGFDQSGVRSWTVYAAGGNLLFASGDGSGAIQANAVTAATADFSGAVQFQGTAAIEGGTAGSGYGVFKGYSPNDNHFISVRGIVATGQSTPNLTGGHQTTFVEHAENNDTTGWYWKSRQTGTYQEIGRLTRTGGFKRAGNQVWDAGNDGSGSGLDADTLDGQHGSYYQPAGSYLTAETLSSTNTVTVTGTKYFQPAGSATSPLGGSGGSSLQAYAPNNGTAAYMAFHRSSQYAINWGLDTSNTMVLGGWSSSTTVPRMSIGTNGLMVTAGQGNLWGAGNDGSGSGLDADLLDGINSASFMRSDTADSFTAIPTFANTANGTLAARTGFSDFIGYNSSYGSYIGGGVSNAGGKYLYAGGYMNDGGTVGTLWRSTNDGSGSGLDADLLDGYNAEESAVNNSIVKRDGTASIKAHGLSLMRASTSVTGISWYNESYYNWQDYMGAPGQGSCGPNGNLTPPTGLAGVTSWALRSRMEGVTTYGWNWETGGSGGGGATATSKMSLNATTGNLALVGTCSASGFYDQNSSGFYVDPAISTNLQGTTATPALKVTQTSAGGNVIGSLFQNATGNFAWGCIAEYRINGTTGTDKPSIIFSHANNSETYTVGFGYTDSNFRIKKDHGHRNGGWGTSLMTMDRSGNVTFAGNVTAYSDERLKTEIKTIENPLDTISKLRGVTFKWKESGDDSMGVIAQEVEAIAETKCLVSETPEDGNGDINPKNVAYGNMVGLLIEGMKEQQTVINRLVQDIKDLKDKIK